MKICIIGGGLCGLSSAYHLSGNAEIHILEKGSTLGGCLSSYQIHDYWIEKYYHHCFSGDRHLIGLMKDLGIAGDLEWLKGSTGYYVKGSIYPLTTPREILRYPFLTITDKARLALLTLRSKQYDASTLDDVPARSFIERSCGIHVYESFFEPLLRSKFGDMAEEVSAAWLMSRIAIRSDRGTEGERLGYLKGGYHRLIDRLEAKLEQQGCQISINTPAKSVSRANGKWEVNGTRYDAVIATLRPSDLTRIGGPQLPSIPYQGAACMTLGLERDVTKGIYWVNMKDEAPYGAVIGHTNFVPFERYGEHIVYLASYFRDVLPADFESRMLEDFCRRFSVKKDELHWHHLTVEEAAGPIYTTGYRHLIPPYTTGGIYLAGMYSRPNYPERSMEGAVVTGKEVASCVMGGKEQ